MYSIHIAYEEYELNTRNYRSAKKLAETMGIELVLDRSERKPHYYKYRVEIWDDTDMKKPKTLPERFNNLKENKTWNLY